MQQTIHGPQIPLIALGFVGTLAAAGIVLFVNVSRQAVGLRGRAYPDAALTRSQPFLTRP